MLSIGILSAGTAMRVRVVALGLSALARFQYGINLFPWKFYSYLSVRHSHTRASLVPQA